MTIPPESWLSGPIDGVPALLQPVAHALLQSSGEIRKSVVDFPADRLWIQPVGLASVGFHLQHIRGVLDRLFTYAEGKPLSFAQMKYLSEEGLANDSIKAPILLAELETQIQTSIGFLKTIDPSTLTDKREVGRKQLPSTVIGLLFHSAEHTMRHTGQLLVTSRVVTYLTL